MADKITPLHRPLDRDHRPVARAPDDGAAVDWPAWPTYGLIEDLLPVLSRWQAQGRRAALATLVDVTGSSPRPIGSEMAISDAGEVAGYVSGGCVEGAVAAQAREVLATGRPVLLDYGAGSPVLDVQLTCGGRIGIFVRALPDLGDYVTRLQKARNARVAVTVAIDLSDGAHVFDPGATAGNNRIFPQTYLPPPRLVVAGSDPITLALCRLAPAFGYDVGLLRPYGPSAAPAGSNLFYYDMRPLTRALDNLALDAWTAVYTLTHDMDDDHAVLVHALRSPAFSVGALGSRRKAAQREARLRAEGFDDAALERLHSPAGLPIGAREPHEIALSVLAELVAHRPRAAACL